MSKTINTHVYNLTGTGPGQAAFGTNVSGIPYSARLSTISARQNGEPGDRVTRAIDITVADAGGVLRKGSASVTVFLPSGLASSDVEPAFNELKAWVVEAGFFSGVANRSVE